MSNNLTVKEIIEDKLRAGFPGAQVEVVDESHKHAGHAGARPEGETHFQVTLVSSVFADQNRLARHRAVMALLQDELNGPVHALAIRARAPGEE